MKPTKGIPQAGVRVLVRYWYGFAVAEFGDTLILLSRGNPINQKSLYDRTYARVIERNRG